MPEAVYRPVEIKEGVHWVGAVDWDVREFHGHHYHTTRGTSYNCYLVQGGERTALVDTVMAPFTAEMLERISALLPLERLDYMVVNHVEIDHSGAVPAVMERAPQATVICTPAGEKALRQHYRTEGWNIRTVGAGDSVDLGGRTLAFVPAPMLHWPDSMFTYCPELRLLMPNDAFGQHYAASERFDDQVDHCVLMDEASKYYANILTPFDRQVERKLAEVQQAGIAIEMIAPSHGIIWRANPGEIVQAYAKWCTSPGEPRVIVAYDSMWGSTERMARAVMEGVEEAGVEARMYLVPVSDRTALVRDIVESRGLALGCATINRRCLPAMAEILEELRGLRPEGKIGFAFGSHGWGGGAIKVVEDTMQEIAVTRTREGIKATYRPTPDDLAACRAAGRELAEAVRGEG